MSRALPYVAVVLAGAVVGQGIALGEEFTSFAALRRHHETATFEATARYLTAHPSAPDAIEAYRFLFETAQRNDLLREARPLAERFLQTFPEASVADRSLARRVGMLSLAVDGEVDAAIDLFGEELSAIRRLDSRGTSPSSATVPSSRPMKSARPAR